MRRPSEHEHAVIKSGELGCVRATLDWVAAQAWSSGEVFMWGESYSGFTQLAAAATGHAALRGITPRNVSGDLGRGWSNRNEVPRLLFQALWATHAGIDEHMYDVSRADIDWWAATPRYLLTVNFGRGPADYVAWSQRRSGDDYWRRVAYGDRSLAHAARVPALHIGGWFDQFRHAQTREWRAAHGLRVAPQILEIRATDHIDFVMGDAAPEDVEAAVRCDPSVLVASQIRFFRWLLGVGAEPKAVTLETAFGAGVQDGPQVPNAPSHPRRRDDHRQARIVPVTWVHHGWDPVPSTQDDEIRWAGAPTSDLSVADRVDVVSARTEPVRNPMLIAGSLRLTARVTLQPDVPGYLMVKLLDISPNGQAVRVADGASLLPRSHTDVSVDLGPTRYVVAAGHRIGVLISATDFPRYPLPPSKIHDLWGAASSQDGRYRCEGIALHVQLRALHYR